jgi:structural maintenance of chromosome 3 (chondroitin sulfate proteoglycan 6)
LKEKTKLTFTINDLMEEVRGDNDSRKRAEEELEKLRSQIAAKEAELENIKPQVINFI